MTLIEQANHPAVVGSVGGAGYAYTLFGLPMSDVIGWATLIGVLVSTLGNLPKAIRTVRGWINWHKNE